MKKSTILLILTLFFCCFCGQEAMAQGNFLKKLKKKAEEKATEAVFGEEENNNSGGTSGSEYSPSGSNSPANTKGGGLTTEPPDVMGNIGEAGDAFGNKKYADARFAVRQAILGIELEIGNNILEGLPEKIDGLSKIEDEDQVASSGIGFVGLIIERTYREGDKQFKVTIGNDAAMLSAANMYLASGAYGTSTDDNHKIVKLDGHRAVLEYDEYSGYKLSVPFGQSSVLITEGINFETEDEMMSASGEINIANIKKELGEE
ncbi:MAG: hypothetical protein ACLFPE_09475 [Bacteroidales bacterium]